MTILTPFLLVSLAIGIGLFVWSWMTGGPDQPNAARWKNLGLLGQILVGVAVVCFIIWVLQMFQLWPLRF